jgi:hypothetical protein
MAVALVILLDQDGHSDQAVKGELAFDSVPRPAVPGRLPISPRWSMSSSLVLFVLDLVLRTGLWRLGVREN